MRACALVRHLLWQARNPIEVQLVFIGDGDLRTPLGIVVVVFIVIETVTARTCCVIILFLPYSICLIESLAHEIGVVVNFRGTLNRKGLVYTLADEADVLVVPTVRNETYSMVCAEGLALGLPVVTFGVGGISDYLQLSDTHGVVVKEPSIERYILKA